MVLRYMAMLTVLAVIYGPNSMVVSSAYVNQFYSTSPARLLHGLQLLVLYLVFHLGL
jgi:hypothetical protein